MSSLSKVHASCYFLSSFGVISAIRGVRYFLPIKTWLMFNIIIPNLKEMLKLRKILNYPYLKLFLQGVSFMWRKYYLLRNLRDILYFWSGSSLLVQIFQTFFSKWNLMLEFIYNQKRWENIECIIYPSLNIFKIQLLNRKGVNWWNTWSIPFQEEVFEKYFK